MDVRSEQPIYEVLRRQAEGWREEACRRGDELSVVRRERAEAQAEMVQRALRAVVVRAEAAEARIARAEELLRRANPAWSGDAIEWKAQQQKFLAEGE
jgi:hypothetical protein